MNWILRNELVRVAVLCAALLVLPAAAHAVDTNMFCIRGSPQNIYRVNLGSGNDTAVYSGYPGNSSATLAMRPSDSQLFYVENNSNGNVYRWNPATPGTAPVLLGALGSGVSSSFRLTFSPVGTLYYMDNSGNLYTLNQSSGAASLAATITGTGSGGDMAFGPDGTFYIMNNTTLYSASTNGGAATSLGSLSGIAGSAIGLAFDAAGRAIVLASHSSDSAYYVLDLDTQVATKIGDASGSTSTGDIASITPLITDLAVTVSGSTNVIAGGTLVYSVTVTNKGPNPARDVIITDTLPGGVTFVSANGGGTHSGGVVTWPTMTSLASGGASNFTVTVTAPASGTLTNVVGGSSFNVETDASSNNGSTAAGRVVTTVTPVTISGNVFEDVNYGGGSGRSKTTAGGVSRSGARVELFNSSGAFVTFTNTDGAGNFTFSGLLCNTTNTVRVVGGSVTSSRPGYTGSCLGVQTFRRTAESGSAADDNDRIGGEHPHLNEAGNGSSTLGALTSGSAAPQSLCTVALGTNSVSGVDFGYNFSTICNTNDSGHGSLRQFLINANALGNSGLAQAGQTAGKECSIFMIPDGSARPGLRSGLVNQLTSGVAVIAPATALPALTDPDTTIDGGTQTTNVGDSNVGVLGVGGTVGVDLLPLGQVNRPEVQIRHSGGTLAIGCDVQANNVTIRKVGLSGFGTVADHDSHANIRVGNNVTGTLIEYCVIGSSVASFTDPGASRSGGDNIRCVGGDNGTIRHNLIGFSAGKGVALENTSTGWSLSDNEIRGNGIGNNTLPGVRLGTGCTATLQGNLITAHPGAGADASGSAGGHLLQNNTISACGSGGTVTPGVRVGGNGCDISRNVITGCSGAGVLVGSTATQNKISRNSIHTNGGIAIDLLSDTDDDGKGTAPYYSLNDDDDADEGGNRRLNFPVITSATITNGSLVLNGYARPGSAIELFVADNDASGFGGGQTYLTTLTEGSGDDSDATSGSYSGVINGLNQGSDTTTKFTFAVPTPAGVTLGTRLTATATDGSNNTSEFCGRVVVAATYNLGGYVYFDANHNGLRDAAEAGTGLSLYAKLIPTATPAGPATQAVAVNGSSGGYLFTLVAPGSYTIIIDNNATLSDVTPTLPAGWSGVEMPAQTRTVVVSVSDLNNLNFGLLNALTLSGKVFLDTGAGGGTANDGVPNGGEAGKQGVVVRLTDNSGATSYDTATTDGGGNYSLLVPSALTNGTVLKVVKVNAGGFLATGAGVGNTGGTYDRATDAVTFTLAAGSVYTGVNFGAVPVNVFVNDSLQHGVPGGFVLHPHSFTAGSAGTVTFSIVSAPRPAVAGWNAVIIRDANGNGQLDAGDTLITAPISVSAGERVNVLIKDYIPLTAPFNAQDQLTITALFTYSGASPALTASALRTDLTTAGTPGGGALMLVKATDRDTAFPGQVITYTVTYANRGGENLGNLIIYDVVPAYTTFTSASAGALAHGLTGVTISAPGVGTTGPLRWTFTGLLSPGASGNVTFAVRLAQ